MREVSGVTDINSHGGYAKSYEVQIDPDRMSSQGIAAPARCWRHSNATTPAPEAATSSRMANSGSSAGHARLGGVEDIEKVVVRSPAGGVPVLIRNIGSVQIAALVAAGGGHRRWPLEARW